MPKARFCDLVFGDCEDINYTPDGIIYYADLKPSESFADKFDTGDLEIDVTTGHGTFYPENTDEKPVQFTLYCEGMWGWI